MVSSTPDPDRAKPFFACSTNPSRYVRVIARIRGFTDKESESVNEGSTPWICFRKHNEFGSSEKVTISFGDQPASRKDAYEMDYCYEQNDDIGLIFSREIKPLISGVLGGQNASVIAYGARGSGKTYTIQGSEEKPGLATLAITEFLSMAEEMGNFVSVSFYEVLQDRVYDLLDSNHPEIQLLENAQGKIMLKGLSQVTVNSISEFHKLYYSSGSSSRKPTPKIALELTRRSHKGLMINMLSREDNSKIKLVGKMNFVDLAGYEDARRNNNDSMSLVESTRINKSLYALLNVVYALNANESRVPYRESKLTRVLQDSLGGTNPVLMLTCLNPSVCQDTMYTVSLASRCTNQLTDSIKRSKNSAKAMMSSSLKNGKPTTVSASMKKETSSQARFYEKKSTSVVNGRKLFDDGNTSTSKQAKLPPDNAPAIQPGIASVVVPSLQKEEKSTEDVFLTIVPKEEVILPASVIKESEFTSKMETDIAPHNESNNIEATPVVANDIKSLTLFEETGDNLEKENKSSLGYEGGSPPLSARLRELSNNLKSLCSSTPTPLNIKRAIDINIPSSGQAVCSNLVEPKTPVFEKDVRASGKWELSRLASPREMFNQHNSGMKNSLIQDYLQFLNSASKDELKGLKGIGEKRATYIMELREESPQPFKNLDDLQDIGLSAKQIKGMMKKVAGELFS